MLAIGWPDKQRHDLEFFNLNKTDYADYDFKYTKATTFTVFAIGEVTSFLTEAAICCSDMSVSVLD